VAASACVLSANWRGPNRPGRLDKVKQVLAVFDYHLEARQDYEANG
jgi:hypothetical protein